MRHSFAFALLALTACASLTEASADVPGAAEVQRALSVCAGRPVVHDAECRATDEPTEFACNYRLRDGDLEGVPQQTVIAADGGTFVLIDIPNHCEPQ